MQSDMSLSNDSFVATVTNQDAVLADAVFRVEVVPLIANGADPFVCHVDADAASASGGASQGKGRIYFSTPGYLGGTHVATTS